MHPRISLRWFRYNYEHTSFRKSLDVHHLTCEWTIGRWMVLGHRERQENRNTHFVESMKIPQSDRRPKHNLKVFCFPFGAEKMRDWGITYWCKNVCPLSDISEKPCLSCYGLKSWSFISVMYRSIECFSEMVSPTSVWISGVYIILSVHDRISTEISNLISGDIQSANRTISAINCAPRSSETPNDRSSQLDWTFKLWSDKQMTEEPRHSEKTNFIGLQKEMNQKSDDIIHFNW
jgi:hypothetical protein